MKNQQGFTLIELVVVIVILGILAAVAVPKFIDMREEADEAAIAGVAGAVASAMAINYAGCSVVGHLPTANKCEKVSLATAEDQTAALAAINPVLQGDWPSEYGVTCTPVATVDGAISTCTVTKTGVTSVTFQLIAAGHVVAP